MSHRVLREVLRRALLLAVVAAPLGCGAIVSPGEDGVGGDAQSEGGACAPIVHTDPGGCVPSVEYPCGIPGGAVSPGISERCRSLCAAVPHTGPGPMDYCGSSNPFGDRTRSNTVYCGACVGGRLIEGLALVQAGQHHKTPGDWLAETASMEAIAAVAFERLSQELSGLGAPEGLVQGALRAACDERRHAAVVGLWASRVGREPTAIASREAPARTLADIAIENAAEGCVRETLGAAMMAWQAQHARDPAMREDFAAIADEEAQHAQWSWELDAWARTQLSAADTARMDHARTDAIASMRSALTAREPTDALRVELGIAPVAAIENMVSVLRRELWLS
ncbi:MAG: ferritin-like domain-containing protein [Deltaproteobacteria bacterium]|nr:ferritin-like domain-containing protein [Deltaproteobacteria bacterium]